MAWLIVVFVFEQKTQINLIYLVSANSTTDATHSIHTIHKVNHSACKISIFFIFSEKTSKRKQGAEEQAKFFPAGNDGASPQDVEIHPFDGVENGESAALE